MKHNLNSQLIKPILGFSQKPKIWFKAVSSFYVAIWIRSCFFFLRNLKNFTLDARQCFFYSKNPLLKQFYPIFCLTRPVNFLKVHAKIEEKKINASISHKTKKKYHLKFGLLFVQKSQSKILSQVLMLLQF